MVHYCCVKGCMNNSSNSKNDPTVESFHVFPVNPHLRRLWVRAIGRPNWNPSNHVRICSAHFSPDNIVRNAGKTRIKEYAWPDIALPPNSKFDATHIKACRICLATDIKIFSLDIGVLKNCTESIASFKSMGCEIDGLPRFVCYECAAHLLKFNNLLEKSMTAQATLLDIFAENAEITTRLVRRQPRKQLNLQSTLSSHNSTPCHFFEYVYEDAENISYLKNKYCTGINPECEISLEESKDIMLKYEVTDTELTTTEDKIEDGDYYEVEYLSESETDEKRSLNSLTCHEKIINSDEDNGSNTEDCLLVIADKKNKPNKTQKRKWKKRSSRAGLTAEEVELQKYFKVIKLSEEQQIDEWNKDVGELLVTSERVFKCEVCLKSFTSKNLYERHVVYHDRKLGTAVCPVCKFRFTNSRRLNCHIKSTHKMRFHCKICSKVYNNANTAKIHYRRHKVHVYSCAHCAFSSAHRAALAQHARTRHAHAHPCARCGHAFSSARGLAYHVKRAHGNDENETTNAEFRCKECEINFFSEGARRIHILTSKEHLKNSQRLSSDPSTLKKLKEEEARAERRRRPVKTSSQRYRLPGDSYPTLCEHCGMEVKNRKEHWLHTRREHKDLLHHYRPVVTTICETCGKGFQNQSKLRLHELRHRSPTVRCGVCGRMFYDKYALGRHSACHRARASHACRECGRTFTIKGNLQRHQRVHTGEFPYQCNLCGKFFRYSSNMGLHKRTVHLKLPRTLKGITTAPEQ